MAYLCKVAKVVNLVVILSIFLKCSKVQHTHYKSFAKIAFMLSFVKFIIHFDQDLLAKSLETKLQLKRITLLQSEQKECHKKSLLNKIYNQNIVDIW